MNYRPGRDDSPGETGNAQDATNIAYQSNVRQLREILNRTAVDPEELARAAARLTAAYDALCEQDPVFGADQNETEGTELEELIDEVRKKMERTAQEDPENYQRKRQASQHRGWYPLLTKTPGEPTPAGRDAGKGDAEPPGWFDWVKRWQPFAEPIESFRPTPGRRGRLRSYPESKAPGRIHIYRPPGAAAHRAFVRPSRFNNPLNQRVLPEVHKDSPMDLDLSRRRGFTPEAVQRSGSYRPRSAEPMDISAVVSPGGKAVAGAASGSRKRQRMMEIGRHLKRKLTPTLRRKNIKATSPRSATASEAADEIESSQPASSRDYENQSKDASRRGSDAPTNHKPPTPQRQAKGTEAQKSKTHATYGALKYADASTTTDRSGARPQTISTQLNGEVDEYGNLTEDIKDRPFWRVSIASRQPGSTATIGEALQRAFDQAKGDLDLHLLVTKLTIKFYVRDLQTPHQSTAGTRDDAAIMEAVQEQLNQLRGRVETQEAELERYRREANESRQAMDEQRRRGEEQAQVIADHQRREREQANDREQLLARIRDQAPPPRGTSSGSSGPTSASSHGSDHVTAGPSSGHVPPDRAAREPGRSGMDMEARMQRMEEEFRLQKQALQDELSELRTARSGRDARQELEQRAAVATQSSQRHRALIAGEDRTAVAERYRPRKAGLPNGAEEAEKDMITCLQKEDEHRAGLPRVGEGFHYLEGDTPFWREPWPDNWRVVKPWEFTQRYDQRDMQQQIKNLQLAQFDGDHETYPQWQCVFYKTVHVQDMDIDVKYNYLIRHLSPSIRAFAVRGVSYSSSKYCHAITRLEKKYGAGERRLEKSMARLRALKPFQKHETARAEEFVQRLQGYLDESGGDFDELAAQTLMPTLRAIIPPEWHREYVDWVRTAKTVTNPETLLAHISGVLDREEELREYAREGRAILPPAVRRTPNPPITARSPRREPTRNHAGPVALFAGESAECPCCCGSHRLKQCPKFLQEYDNFERREMLERLGYCLVCFTGTHRGRGCLNRRLCELCRGEHSTWAHVPDDEDEQNALFGEAEGEEPEAFDQGDEPLSGESLGHGFDEDEEADEVAEDDLRYGFMALAPAAGAALPEPRRSARIESRRRARSAEPAPGGLSPYGAPAYQGPPPQRPAGRPAPVKGPRRPTATAWRPFSTPVSPATSAVGVGRLPVRGRASDKAVVPANADTTARAAPYRSSPSPGDWFGRDENGNELTFPVAPQRGYSRDRPTSTTPQRLGRTNALDGPKRAVTFREPLMESRSPPRPGLTLPTGAPATPTPVTTVTRKDVVCRPPGQRIGVGLQQVLVNVQNPQTKAHITVNGLIDTGSNHTAISQRLASKLGVDGITSPYRVVTFGGEVFHQQSKLVRVTLRSTDGFIERTVMVRSVTQLCGDLRVWAWNDLKHPWPHLREVQFPDPVGDLRVDVLIGTENTDLVRVTRPDVAGKAPQDPVLRYTAFGPVAMGLVRPWHDALEERVNLVQAFACPSLAGADKDRLLELESALYWDLRRLFAVEHQIEEDFLRHVKDSKTLGKEQAEAAAYVHATREYDPVRRQYQAGIPWRSTQRPENNLWAAMRLFRSYVRRAGPDSAPIANMTTTVDGWIKSGYARVLTPTEARERDSFVIPSFVVTRIDKTSTQHRLVINAAKQFEGRCLNDYIARTPDVMNNLYEVLLRFRCGHYTYTADIQHMFLRVRSAPEDRRYVRLLYQPVKGGGIHVVECSRHMFGLRSSPFVAIEVIKTHAKERAAAWPLASAAVLHASIVDDVLLATDSLHEMRETHRQLEGMFGEMSMNIHKCASNDAQFMANLPPSQRAKQVRLEDISSSNPEIMPVIKALGMVYRSEDDCFRFEYGHEAPRRWTLRGMVATVARLYDPLGLVAPFLMAGRAIIQVIWMSGRQWDDPLDETTSAKCDRWVDCARELIDVRVPRMVFPASVVDRAGGKLVLFSDACRVGYAAAAYYVRDGGSRLVAARTRVAPTRKDESVQRLELAGCQLATDVAVEVCQALGLDLRAVDFYTDSMTSLAWLRTTSRMSVFVSNRVCKVRDRTELEQWRYVPGELNPADIASRGSRPRALALRPMWFEGPEFLRTGQVPAQPDLVEDQAVKDELISYENQLKKITVFCALLPQPLVTEFIVAYVDGHRLLRRAVRVLSLVLRAVGLMRRRPETSAEIFRELWPAIINLLSQRHQHEAWPEVIAALRSGKPVRQLQSLRPFLDAFGVLRMRSRLNGCWWMDYESRNPIILKGSGAFVEQLMYHVHAEELKHAGGPTQLLNAARAKYWVTTARHLARRTVETCRRCRLEGQKPCRPIMADLHPTRLGRGEDLHAFKDVGVDMAGPFITRRPARTRSHGSDLKRYLLIITCCTTRAVCLELMMSADTESCLMALERFVAVYGRPERINSDSGTNLLGSREAVRRQWQWWNAVKTAAFASYPSIQWQNNPPYSPNWGGHYERLIGVAKKALGKVMDGHRGLLRDEELATMFKKVQSLLNDRPLTAVVQDDDTLLSLTPNCFLKTGGRGPLLPPGHPGVGLRRRYQLLENITTQYWRQFLRDYVSTLHKTEKWVRNEPPLAVGDVVAILHQGTTQGRWPLGRIAEVHPGKDGVIRAATVQTWVGGRRSEVRRSVSGMMLITPNQESRREN